MIRTVHLIAALGLTGVTARAQVGDAHTGPVTAIAIGGVDGKVYSCSQGGVFEGAGPAAPRAPPTLPGRRPGQLR